MMLTCVHVVSTPSGVKYKKNTSPLKVIKKYQKNICLFRFFVFAYIHFIPNGPSGKPC